MRLVWPLALLLSAPALALAQQPSVESGPQASVETPESATAAEGSPHAGGVLADREFGVVTRQFGLRRQVEMAQWQRRDGDYALAWSRSPVDSSAFPERYRNPGEFRLPSREWTSPGTMPDGRPLAAEAVEALGIWRPLAPDPAVLPENLAATFQEDDGMLTTAADPAAPSVGDLRIRWFERILPSLEGRVALEDGVWVLAPDVQAAPAEVPPADAEGALRNYTPWLGGLLLLIAAVVVATRHRKRRRPNAP